MSPTLRYRVIAVLEEILPLPVTDCMDCDPNGGCPNPTRCRSDLAEDVLNVIERESA
jgi:hypothetical protein